ncbi:hypothetical protein ATANTOWER_028330 [Ataeniobius toweri]|uniref:Uncharacterized protein n=1 Tax=Ataeniobius toweri TaxID=208326 RepID=A0ABU7ARV1_9TELE|nr:hypothetical protein [Ataeniobius toweri]
MYHLIFDRVLAEQKINDSKMYQTNMKKITQEYPQHSQGPTNTHSHKHIVTHNQNQNHQHSNCMTHITRHKIRQHTHTEFMCISLRIKSRINEPLFLLKARERRFTIK